MGGNADAGIRMSNKDFLTVLVIIVEEVDAIGSPTAMVWSVADVMLKLELHSKIS